MDPTTADAIAAIVADLRPLHDDLALPDTCEIVRVTTVPDGRGGTTTTESTIDTVRCALDVSGQSGNEYVAGSVENVNLPYTITLPYGTDVNEQDTIGVDGRTFAVETVRSGGGYEIAVEAACREVE